jgi:hypothetical protein
MISSWVTLEAAPIGSVTKSLTKKLKSQNQL